MRCNATHQLFINFTYYCSSLACKETFLTSHFLINALFPVSRPTAVVPSLLHPSTYAVPLLKLTKPFQESWQGLVEDVPWLLPGQDKRGKNNHHLCILEPHQLQIKSSIGHHCVSLALQSHNLRPQFYSSKIYFSINSLFFSCWFFIYAVIIYYLWIFLTWKNSNFISYTRTRNTQIWTFEYNRTEIK